MNINYRRNNLYKKNRLPDYVKGFFWLMIFLVVFSIVILFCSQDYLAGYHGYEVIDKGRWGRYGTPKLVLKGPDRNGNDRIVTLGVNNDTYYYYDIGDELE